MNDIAPNPTPTAPPPLGRRLLSYALRAAVAGLILGVGVWTLEGIAALFKSGDAEPVPAAADNTAPPTPITAMANADLMAGAWSFMDEGWDITAELLDTDEANKRLEAAPSDETASAPLPEPSPSSRRGDELLAVVKPRATRARIGALWRYTLAQNGCTMQIYANGDDAERLRQATLLVPYGEDQAWLMQFRPEAATASTDAASGLPMFGSLPAKLLCARMRGSDDVWCQLWSIEAPLVDVLGALSRDGWEIERPSGERESSFATIHIQRAGESRWLVVTAFENDPSLRVMVVHDALPHPVE